MKRILATLALAVSSLVLVGLVFVGTPARAVGVARSGAPPRSVGGPLGTHGAARAEVLWQPAEHGRGGVRPAPFAGRVASLPVASASGWQVEAGANATMAAGTLVGVSCATATSCVAVGYADSRGGSQVVLVERRRGGRWLTDAVPVPTAAVDTRLTGVSCPSTAFCVAVGYYYDRSGDIRTLAETWNGRAWMVATTPNPAGSAAAGLFAVSCTSALACTAVGDDNRSVTASTLGEHWDGRTWKIARTPNPSGATASGLFGVSCRSATSCTAVGSSVATGPTTPLVESLSGRGWTLGAAAIPSSGAIASGLSAVGCASPSTCVAVGYLDRSDGVQRTLAETRDGAKWAVAATVDPAGSTGSGLAGVSCGAASQCVAVGQYNDRQRSHVLAERWNGSVWSRQVLADPARSDGSGLSGLSCAVADACVAVGGFSRWSNPIGLTMADVWNGTGWKATTTADPTGAQTTVLRGLSCPATGRCVAVGAHDDLTGTSRTFAEALGGRRWRTQYTPGPSRAITSQLTAVACVSAADCLAVGTTSPHAETSLALIERWNGHGWVRQRPASLPPTTSGNLFSVSCASADDCTAVGSYSAGSGRTLPLVEHSNGRRWTQQRSPRPPGSVSTQLLGVSCRGPAACTAVGDYGTRTGSFPLAERWNGTVWQLQHPPTPAHAFEALFDAVSCRSAAACTAVGSEVNASDRVVGLVERWHGGSWSVQPTPTLLAARAELLGVSCGSSAACVAVGYQVTTGPTLPLVETWNGRQWALTPTPVPPGTVVSLLNSVSCPSARVCTAAGYRFGRLGIQTSLVVGRR